MFNPVALIDNHLPGSYGGISAAKTAFLEPEALTESDIRSGDNGPREVTKGNKIFAKTALGCNFETSSQSSV